MSRSSGNANMYDTGLLYEAMKARPIPCPPLPLNNHHQLSGGGTTNTSPSSVNSISVSGGTPIHTSNSSSVSPTNTGQTTPKVMMLMSPGGGNGQIADTENNLNKGGSVDKGVYTDKHVLNIDQENYMLKCGPPSSWPCLTTNSNSSSSSTSPCTRSSSNIPLTPTTSDQILFNVTAASDCRTSNALTCICRTGSHSLYGVPSCDNRLGETTNNSSYISVSTEGSLDFGVCGVCQSYTTTTTTSSPSGGGIGGSSSISTCTNCIGGNGVVLSHNPFYENGSSSSTLYNSNNSRRHLSVYSHTLCSILPLVECRACFHNICTSYSSAHPCIRPHHVLPPPTLTTDVPISQWSSSNVVDWMATLNLAPYTEIFKAKDIKGSDLLNLDRDKLVNMGIKDEFHQKAIIVSVGQLQKECSDGLYMGDSTAIGAGDCTTPASQHNLRNHSFHDLHRCDKCGLYLRGFVHQGQFCQDCGVVAHRTCAATGLPPCVRQSSKYIRRIMLSSVFGLSLCTQFSAGESPAPLLLVRCCQEIVYRVDNDPSIDPYRLYRNPPQQETLNQLRQECDKDMCNVDLSSYEAHVIAYLIKRYLRELPEPVIHEAFYDRFIEASRIDNDDQCAKCMTQLVSELHPHHYYTLKFLMHHFLQLCQIQIRRGTQEPPILLTQSLCHVLLRPPWEKIVELARNTEAHMRIVEILLLKVDWGEKVPTFAPAPVLPPRPRPSVTSSTCSSEISESKYLPPPLPKSLHEAEWYWGPVGRDDVNILMKDTLDGTFLVRDASSGNNEYTLTLRKGGSNKLIKICHQSGMYGFTEPLTFSSVVELVYFFREHSLVQFNKALDIRLLHPVSRFRGDETGEARLRVEDLLGRLNALNEQYLEKVKQYTGEFENQVKLASEIQMQRNVIDNFDETISWIEDQLKIHDKFSHEAQPHEIHDLLANRQILVNRLEQVKSVRDNNEGILTNLRRNCQAVERQCASLNLEVSKLSKNMDQLKNSLLSRGFSAEMIDKWLKRADTSVQTSELRNESLWRFDACSRKQAILTLKNKSNGTFLIRKSTNVGYALSIIFNDDVEHCKIFQGESGFGFAEPFLIYPTLMELVLHYAEHSLVMHNDRLDTKLKYPARSLS